MTLKKILRNIGLYTITGWLTIGVIIGFGLLSASGMLILNPAMALLIAAFIFGGVVEGEVFKQEIFEGLQDFALLGQKGYRYLISQALEDSLKIAPAVDGFLLEYQNLTAYLKSTRGKKLTEAQKSEKKSARKQLKHMQEFFTEQVLSTKSLASTPFATDITLAAKIVEIQQQQSTFKTKMVLFRIALPFSILCGAGFGLAIAPILPAALALISVTLSFLVWPLVITIAIGYTFLIFRTVREILFSARFEKWKTRIKSWFPSGPVTPSFVLKAVGMGLIVAAIIALCVMGTLATAGTWWIVVEKGAKLIPYIQNIASVLRSILTPLLVFGNFLFSTYNSLDSLHKVIKAIKNSSPVTDLKAQWQKLIAEENWLQVFNPFRIVCKIVQKSMDTLLLLGHVAASGAGRDQFLNLPNGLLAAGTAGSELTQDVTFFFETGKKTMTQKAVIFLLSPLLLLSACWQTLASRLNNKANQILFQDACKEAFDIVEKEKFADAPPAPSPAWRTLDITRAFAKEEQRLGKAVVKHTKAQEKMTALTQFKNDLINMPALFTPPDKKILGKHRFFSVGPARSEMFADKMMRSFRY